ncbi:MAG: glycosyltransferase [Actinobacteria bacterium]|nr:glycosyltransferase [Actinomycetota bacterium]
MLLTVTLVAVVSLALATALVVVAGQRVDRTSRTASVALAVTLAVVGGEVAAAIWGLPLGPVLVGEAWVVAVSLPVIMGMRTWNPIGHVALATYVAAAVSYLAFVGQITFVAGLGPIATGGSVLLLLMEIAALTITCLFAFEAFDVLCRVSWKRSEHHSDPDHQPFVSIHVPAYNEPPEMLIGTIRSLEALDYPHYEIVVIDNNTEDPEVWHPVRDYCESRELVTFVHVDPWPGYKSGALNLALDSYTDPRAEVVGIVDADYRVEPDWLTETVGYFADPELAFVQTPQDYHDWEDDPYLTACYDAYEYSFAVTMRSRNERDGSIFAGTMGLIRRDALEQAGGWDEWCITEDAEVSLRLLKQGYSGHYIHQTFGHGIMPLTFSALKRQRFRWAFGGVQILRMHWRALLLEWRSEDNHLSLGQRFHYLAGGLGWFIDVLAFGFTAVLLTIATLLITTGSVPLRPLVGAVVLLPTVLIASGLLRGLWALRKATGISWKRASLAFANWLSLSWTVALACVQGSFRAEGVFLRTPKWKGERGIVQALRASRAESAMALGLYAAGVATVVAVSGWHEWFLAGLFAWQGSVYGSASLMAWLNLESELTPALELQRRFGELRQQMRSRAPALAGSGLALLGAGVLAVLSFAGPQSSERSRELFEVPHAEDQQGPLLGLADRMIRGPERAASPIVEVPIPSETTADEPSSPPQESPTAVFTRPVDQGTTGPESGTTSPGEQTTSPSVQATSPAGSTTSPSDQQSSPAQSSPGQGPPPQSSPSETATPPSDQATSPSDRGTEPSQQPSERPSGQPSDTPTRP